MLTIRCTQKVLKKFKLQNHLETTPADPPAPGAITSDAPTSFLNEWYANLIRVDRRHMVGFMNRELTIEAGMDDYVAKPIRVDELIGALSKVTPLNEKGDV